MNAARAAALVLTAGCASPPAAVGPSPASTAPRDLQPPPSASLSLCGPARLLADEPVRFEATGATPGTTVWFVAGTGLGPERCRETAAGEVCTTLRDPRVVARAVASADGSAALEAPAPPPSLAPGDPAYLQAFQTEDGEVTWSSPLTRTLTIGPSAPCALEAICPGLPDADGDGVPDTCERTPTVGDLGPSLWVRADVGVETAGDEVTAWLDLSGNAHHLFPRGLERRPTLLDDGLDGQPALAFDADALDHPDVLTGSAYTKTAVFAVDDLSPNNNLVSSRSGHALWLGASDRVQLWHGGSTFATSDTPVVVGERHVVVGTYDPASGLGRLTLDGIEVATGFAAPIADPSIQLGSFADGNFFAGRLTEVAVFDRVLTDDEQLSLHAALDAHAPVLAPAVPTVADLAPHLWLRADAGVETDGDAVTAWRDLSGAGRDVLPYRLEDRPTWDPASLDGRDAVRFDVTDGLDRGAGMPLGSYTKAVVVAVDDLATNNNLLSGRSQHALFLGFSDRPQLFHGGTFVTSDRGVSLGAAHILVGTYDIETGRGALYLDGTFVGEGYTGPHTDPTLQIGSYAYGNGLDGRLAEAVVYDRVLNELERTQLETALLRHAPLRTITLTEAPASLQLYPRDDADRCTVPLSGVASPGIAAARVELLRDGEPVEVLELPASFDVDLVLDAGLLDHEVVVSAIDDAGEATEVARRSRIACGDVFLVDGQSNAVALDYWAEGTGDDEMSPWVRSYGSAMFDSTALSDTAWTLAVSDAGNTTGSIGAWALRLANTLVAEHGVPIAVINGAVGGTTIAQHQRSLLDPTDPTTIYGRLLSRARAAQVDHAVRGILWHQGESDGWLPIEDYTASFTALQDAWLEDFPAVEAIYLFQVRSGCGDPTVLREAQRQLPALLPRVAGTMSTTGVDGHDTCHFFRPAYHEFGDRMARLVSRDLYGSLETEGIDAPSAVSAELVGPTEVRVDFGASAGGLILEPGTEAWFVLDDGTEVLSARIEGDAVLLTTAGPTSAETLSLIDPVGNVPWLLNRRGVGALVFYDLPILR